MITIEKTDVYGWEAAIRGMRNPMNSWDKSDSHICDIDAHSCPMLVYDDEPATDCNNGAYRICIGQNDHRLMTNLRKAGTEHAKYMRMINVTLDVTAPLYWWKEFDTYKVGTVTNSCSTMHKIHSKAFTLSDFSHEKLLDYEHTHVDAPVPPLGILVHTIAVLNFYRQKFIDTQNKTYWWQMIQLLPTSYNQKRTVQLNYAVLAGIYHQRRNHKLDEWHTFCDWIESLPYSELIMGVLE